MAIYRVSKSQSALEAAALAVSSKVLRAIVIEGDLFLETSADLTSAERQTIVDVVVATAPSVCNEMYGDPVKDAGQKVTETPASGSAIGTVLKSPNGSMWNLTVNDLGILTTTLMVHAT